MDDGQRLWNAILDRPFSRSLRQIYADWLEEHGDPRAELIRLQDRAVPRDPWREVELLRSHEAQWLGSIAQHAQDWTFRHGLLTRVTVEAERFLAHGDEWTRRPGLLGVVLTKARDHVNALAACPWLERIPFLWLDQNDLEAEHAAILATSPHLRRVQWLSLARNALLGNGVQPLLASAHLRRVRALDLGSINMGPGFTLPTAGIGRQVRWLNLFGNELDASALLTWLNAPGWVDSLRDVRLGDAPLRGLLPRLAASPVMVRLRALSLSNVDTPADELQSFAAAPAIAGSRSLILWGLWEMRDEGIRWLVRSPHLRRLRHLSLEGSIQGSEGFACLGEPGVLPGLRSLHASVTYRVDRTDDLTPGMERLFAGTLIRQLRRLNLQNTPIAGTALARLTGKAVLPLRWLRLVIGDGAATEALGDLVSKGCLDRLRALRLTTGNGLAAVINQLGRLPDLRRLDWNSCHGEDLGTLIRHDFAKLESLTIWNIDGTSEIYHAAFARWLARQPLLSLLLPAALNETVAWICQQHLPHLAELYLSMDVTTEAHLAVWPGLARLRYLRNTGDHAEPAQPNLGDSPHWSPTVRVEGQFSPATAERLRERLGPRSGG